MVTAGEIPDLVEPNRVKDSTRTTHRTRIPAALLVIPTLGTLFLLSAYAQNPVSPPAPTAEPTAEAEAKPAGYTGNETPDEPGALWAPAAATNFTPAERPQSHPVNVVVIHDIEGTARGAVSWFQNPRSKVSAHYVVDSVEGTVWQQVLEDDIGWHAGNWDINTRSIGIEHEGYAYRPGYYSDRMYEASARLVRHITRRHNIPRDRQHIIAHAEVPHPRESGKFGGAGAHTDPGPYWDWDYYMALIRNDADRVSAPTAVVLHPGEKRPVTFHLRNIGDDPWIAERTGRRNPEAQAAGPVYLGTAGQNRSTLFGTGWVSPMLAASPDQSVQPGAIGDFTVTLNGPRPFGESAETFRLVRVPPAPYRVVPFGPEIAVKVVVRPWELLWDTAFAGFTAPGWNEAVSQERRVRWQKSPEAPAQWEGKLPISGKWEVYARWTKGAARTQKAVYEVTTANGVQTATVDQRKRAGEWVSLGRFDLLGTEGVSVRLKTDGAGIAVADSLRFVGPFPAQDTPGR
ncbi:MAG: hypothetical protein OHK0029_42560 [Armatimonadaceae bacterium]